MAVDENGVGSRSNIRIAAEIQAHRAGCCRIGFGDVKGVAGAGAAPGVVLRIDCQCEVAIFIDVDAFHAGTGDDIVLDFHCPGGDGGAISQIDGVDRAGKRQAADRCRDNIGGRDTITAGILDCRSIAARIHDREGSAAAGRRQAGDRGQRDGRVLPDQLLSLAQGHAVGVGCAAFIDEDIVVVIRVQSTAQSVRCIEVRQRSIRMGKPSIATGRAGTVIIDKPDHTGNGNRHRRSVAAGRVVKGVGECIGALEAARRVVSKLPYYKAGGGHADLPTLCGGRIVGADRRGRIQA